MTHLENHKHASLAMTNELTSRQQTNYKLDTYTCWQALENNIT